MGNSGVATRWPFRKRVAPQALHNSPFPIPHSAFKLRLWLLLFFLALALPTALLVTQAYRQLKWEAFHRHQLQAQELGGRIDRRITDLVATEEARPFSDYSFLTVAGDPAANFLQRSPLAAFPVRSDIPGLLGWFQVDTDGALSTPLLPGPGTRPDDLGIGVGELHRRRALQARIRTILTENRLVGAGETRTAGTGERIRHPPRPSPATKVDLADESVPREEAPHPAPAMAQAAFDRLSLTEGSSGRKDRQASLGRVEDLQLEAGLLAPGRDGAEQKAQVATAPAPQKRQARKERGALPEPAPSAWMKRDAEQEMMSPRPPVRTFESELDPFELALLDSGQFVLYRKVWRDGQRYIQGALIEQHPFLAGLIETPFRAAALSRMSDLAVAYRGNLLSAFSGRSSRGYLSSAEEMSGALLHRTRLTAPFGGLELIFSITRLPAGPGAAVLGWTTAVLALVLCGGLFLLYRLGLRQLALVRQQQDFVSAVSHELKTPLTSIRMFSEMLREGWAGEEKKRDYYDYIYEESERLSRLIANVLQLARMTRNELRVELHEAAVGELLEDVRPKLASRCGQAGFRLDLDCTEGAGALILADADFLAQILINLVDNAVKFSAKADRKTVELSCRPLRGKVRIGVRDYGPGIPKDQLKKIFKLFYRPRSELTRETVGTGIGLALVRQLARAMGATVDVVNREPGAEFLLAFPIAGKRDTPRTRSSFQDN